MGPGYTWFYPDAPVTGLLVGRGLNILVWLSQDGGKDGASRREDERRRLQAACGANRGIGQLGHHGFGISASMETITYNEEVDTFDLPNSFPSECEFDHLEAWGLGFAPNPDQERSRVQIRRPNLSIRGGNVDFDDLADQIC